MFHIKSPAGQIPPLPSPPRRRPPNRKETCTWLMASGSPAVHRDTGPAEQVEKADASSIDSDRCLAQPQRGDRRFEVVEQAAPGARQRPHRRIPNRTLRQEERGRMFTMVDEIFDRNYQAGRNELNAGLDRAFGGYRPRAFGKGLRRSPSLRVEFAPWAARSSDAGCAEAE